MRRIKPPRVAQKAMDSPEGEWPEIRRRARLRQTVEMDRRVAELRRRRDHAATQLQIEPAFIASRGALEAIAADESRKEKLLVPWQKKLLGLE